MTCLGAWQIRTVMGGREDLEPWCSIVASMLLRSSSPIMYSRCERM